jgi:hypothetical protein
MTYFRARARIAGIKISVYDNAAAYARAQSQHNAIAYALARAELIFRKRGYVGVVGYNDL